MAQSFPQLIHCFSVQLLFISNVDANRNNFSPLIRNKNDISFTVPAKRATYYVYWCVGILEIQITRYYAEAYLIKSKRTR